MVLNNIFFDYNKATFTKTSAVEMEKLLKFIKENPA